ncbi:MAG: hypothetical protein KGJ95_05650, partial [Candidatus Omnitrophica bacterium]|nr:hypothetical protein [Candidatus Omnitrophota bacterium]
MDMLLIIHWTVTIFIPAIIIELIRREINHRGPKLVYYSSQIITHRIVMPSAQGAVQNSPAPQPFWLNSFVLTIRNNGNIAARNVEINHPQAPQHFQLTPNIQHTIQRSEDGRSMTICIPSLGTKEIVSISYLFGPVQNWNDLLEYVRSEDGLAKKINVILNRVFPRWFNIMVLGFCFLGLIFLGVIIWWLYPPLVY